MGWLYDDFDVLVEFHEEAQQPSNGRLPELAAQDLGYVRLANAK